MMKLAIMEILIHKKPKWDHLPIKFLQEKFLFWSDMEKNFEVKRQTI